METKVHIKITETNEFKKDIVHYIHKRRLLADDLIDFKRSLALNPTVGDLIPGTGGVRKIRLKSAGVGKRGGFRVCYYYVVGDEIFLLSIYHKTKQENLSPSEIGILKNISNAIKKCRK